MADLAKTIEFLRSIEQQSKPIKQVAVEIDMPVRSLYALVSELRGLGCPLIVESWGRNSEYKIDQWAAVSWLVSLGVGKSNTTEAVEEQASWLGWPSENG